MRRFFALLAAAAALAGTLLVAAPQPANAQQKAITNAQGCGSTLDPLQALQILNVVSGQTVTWNNIRFACVLALQQLDLGFTALPLGPVVAADMNLNIRFKPTGNILLGNFDLEITLPGDARIDACIPFALGIQLNASTPSVGFSCIGLRTFLKDGQPDNTKGLFGLLPFTIVNLNFSVVGGQTVGQGSVNGIAPAHTELGNDPLSNALEPIVNDAIAAAVSAVLGQGLATELIIGPVRIQTKDIQGF